MSACPRASRSVCCAGPVLRYLCQLMAVLLIAGHAVSLIYCCHQLFYHPASPALSASAALHAANVLLHFVLLTGVLNTSSTLIQIWLAVFGVEVLAGTIGAIVWIYMDFFRGDAFVNALKRLILVMFIAILFGGAAVAVRTFLQQINHARNSQQEKCVCAEKLTQIARLAALVTKNKIKKLSREENEACAGRPYIVEEASTNNVDLINLRCEELNNSAQGAHAPNCNWKQNKSQADIKKIELWKANTNSTRASATDKTNSDIDSLENNPQLLSNAIPAHVYQENLNVKRNSEPLTCWDDSNTTDLDGTSRRGSMDAVLALIKFRQLTLGGRRGSRVESITGDAP